MKINNSQHSFVSPSPSSAIKTPKTESKKEKTVTWKDADIYFQQEARFRTPVPQTGRASVAKLRTQNAGMVLAKAKLFDDPTKEAVDISRRQSTKIQVKNKDEMKVQNGKNNINITLFSYFYHNFSQVIVYYTTRLEK